MVGCVHTESTRPKIFEQSLSRIVRASKQKKVPLHDYVCCTCGKNGPRDHLSDKHPIGYSFEEKHIWCAVCAAAYTDGKHSGMDELLDILENEGLTLTAKKVTAVVTAGVTGAAGIPGSTVNPLLPESLERKASQPRPFYFNPPTKDFLTAHIVKTKVNKKVKKAQAIVHGGHGYSHGPMSSIKKGQVIPAAMWDNMDVAAREVVIKAGARSPAMAAAKRLDALLDSPGYLEGVGSSVYQAVLEKVFDGNSSFALLAGTVCPYLFSEKVHTLRAFVKEALDAHDFGDE